MSHVYNKTLYAPRSRYERFQLVRSLHSPSARYANLRTRLKTSMSLPWCIKYYLQQTVSQISALYFDGRKDQTLIMCEKDRKKYKRRILEEHISLIKEPESKFLGYITSASGTAKSIELEIFNFFVNEDISMDYLIAIGCDGTNVNVGKYNGIVRMIEKRLDRPLQWIICLLRTNELPFRHLFHHIDGSTSGPQTFLG